MVAKCIILLVPAWNVCYLKTRLHSGIYKVAYQYQHLSAIHIYIQSFQCMQLMTVNFYFSIVTCLFFFEDIKKDTLPALRDIRERCINQLEQMRPDHMRRLNPTPYKVTKLNLSLNYSIVFVLNDFDFFFNHEQVSVSAKLYDFIHFLWLNEAPVGELQ